MSDQLLSPFQPTATHSMASSSSSSSSPSSTPSSSPRSTRLRRRGGFTSSPTHLFSSSTSSRSLLHRLPSSIDLALDLELHNPSTIESRALDLFEPRPITLVSISSSSSSSSISSFSRTNSLYSNRSSWSENTHFFSPSSDDQDSKRRKQVMGSDSPLDLIPFEDDDERLREFVGLGFTSLGLLEFPSRGGSSSGIEKASFVMGSIDDVLFG